MKYIGPAVSTLCMGQAASMAVLLLAGGAENKRFTLPHARIMIHQPLGGFQGQASDVDIQAREILRLKEKLNEILSKHTRQPIEKISKDTDRDYFMNGHEAKGYGIVDEVVLQRVSHEEKSAIKVAKK